MSDPWIWALVCVPAVLAVWSVYNYYAGRNPESATANPAQAGNGEAAAESTTPTTQTPSGAMGRVKGLSWWWPALAIVLAIPTAVHLGHKVKMANHTPRQLGSTILGSGWIKLNQENDKPMRYEAHGSGHPIVFIPPHGMGYGDADLYIVPLEWNDGGTDLSAGMAEKYNGQLIDKCNLRVFELRKGKNSKLKEIVWARVDPSVTCTVTNGYQPKND